MLDHLCLLLTKLLCNNVYGDKYNVVLGPLLSLNCSGVCVTQDITKCFLRTQLPGAVDIHQVNGCGNSSNMISTSTSLSLNRGLFVFEEHVPIQTDFLSKNNLNM